MRWWWFGPAVEKAQLEREMRTMKAGGIGGFEIQPVYPLSLDNPATGLKNHPFLSNEFLEALRFTNQTGRSLGLRVDLTLGSGWPFGGPSVGIEHAAARLRLDVVPLAAGRVRVPLPNIGAGEAYLTSYLVPGSGKSLDYQRASQLREVDAEGFVRVPPGVSGEYSVVHSVSSRTGMQVKRPSLGAEGFVLDHLNRPALDSYLREVGEKLLSAFDPPPYAIFSDSLEVYGTDWAADFPQEFRKRRGYDILAHLPALAGTTAQSRQVRYDWSRTLTELAEERYLKPMTEWASARGTQFRSQTYGIPPVSLSSQGLIHLPEGESSFWRKLTPSRWASSGAHLYGKKVVSSETWTWLHSPSFRATPLDMKVEADLHFLQGINQLIGHGWPYSPPSEGTPGWRFYAAGVFNDHNPWWTVMPDLTSYLQRVSYALRQGEPANDIALYVPTADLRARMPLGRPSVNEEADKHLSPLLPLLLDAGYNLDLVDDEALVAKKVAHPVVVLPQVDSMTLASCKALLDYVQNRRGKVLVLGSVPAKVPGLLEEKALSEDSGECWMKMLREKSSVIPVKEVSGMVDALVRMQPPDLQRPASATALGFIKRTLPDGDLYFLANTANSALSANVQLRTRRRKLVAYDPLRDTTVALNARPDSLPLQLAPYQSLIILATDESLPAPPAEPARAPIQTISLNNWTLSFPDGARHSFESPKGWTEIAGKEYFSGIAAYQVTFEYASRGRAILDFGPGSPTAPAPSQQPGMRAQLEPPVREAAVVFVNGTRAGSVWAPPFELDITQHLRPGTNELRIEVANTAINAMAGKPLPNYRLLNLRFGERFQPQDMDKVNVVPSGITGPVSLRIQ